MNVNFRLLIETSVNHSSSQLLGREKQCALHSWPLVKQPGWLLSSGGTLNTRLTTSQVCLPLRQSQLLLNWVSGWFWKCVLACPFILQRLPLQNYFSVARNAWSKDEQYISLQCVTLHPTRCRFGCLELKGGPSLPWQQLHMRIVCVAVSQLKTCRRLQPGKGNLAGN